MDFKDKTRLLTILGLFYVRMLNVRKKNMSIFSPKIFPGVLKLVSEKVFCDSGLLLEKQPVVTEKLSCTVLQTLPATFAWFFIAFSVR